MCYTHSDQRARRFSALTQRSKLCERALSHSTLQAVSEQALCFSLKQQRDTRSVLKLWRQESVRGNEGGSLASASRTRKPDRSAGRKPPVVGGGIWPVLTRTVLETVIVPWEADVLEPGES